MFKPLIMSMIFCMMPALPGCVSSISSGKDSASVERKLGRRVDVHFEGDKLEVALAWFRKEFDLNLVVNRAALEAAGVEMDEPVDLHLTQLPGRRGLELLLRHVDAGLEPIDFSIEDDIVRISTRRDLQSKGVTRHYDLSEFLHPAPTRWTMVAEREPWIRLSSAMQPADQPTREEIIEQVGALIQDTVGRSADWAAYGGDVTSIRVFRDNLRIVAPRNRHREIEELFDARRAMAQRRRIRTQREKEIASHLALSNELRLRGDDAAALQEVGKALDVLPTHPVAVAMKDLIIGARNRRRGVAMKAAASAPSRIVTSGTGMPDAAVRLHLSPEDRSLWRQLDQPISVDFHQTELHEAIPRIARLAKVNIHVDWSVLESNAVVKDIPITFSLKDVPAATVLALTLEQGNAIGSLEPHGFDVRDGVALVSSLARLNADTIVRQYDISDLLAWSLEPASRDEMLENILTLIQDQVGRQRDWAAYGGEHFKLRELHGALIVETTAIHQAEIAVILDILKARMIEAITRALAEQAIAPLLARADELRLKGQHQAALETVEMALAIRPDHPTALAMKQVIKETIQRRGG